VGIRLPVVVVAVLCALSASISADAQTLGRRRALLVGINDYTASRLVPANVRSSVPPAPGRDWPNLTGAANDVHTLEEMLVLLYGFERRDIVTLTDQSATRAAILQAVEQHLVKPAERGDVLFFYFAGHGSQVRNSLSDEADKLDESIVPADSQAGASDIRDKELRPLFNRILDRDARLTVLLDNCHSGSGARGLSSGAHPRGVQTDWRDVADRTSLGPRPEARGALVLSAAEDVDSAWETRDEQGKPHGVFSWAWIRALRDSSAGEAAVETFLRAQARMRAETPFQDPVLAGNIEARLNPFLGVRSDRRAERTVVAVESVQSDGTVIIQGGWANGLAVGSELQVLGEPRTTARLSVKNIRGLGRCEARMQPGRSIPQAIRSGALLEVVTWSAPRGRSLRVWMPRVSGGTKEIARMARLLSAQAAQRGIRWVSDPVNVTPTHLLRRAGSEWELVAPGSDAKRLGDDAAAVAAVSGIAAGSSLFVQFPSPASLVEGIAVGPGSDRDGIEPTDRPEEADYILAGRFAARHLAYAWVRPLVNRTDRRNTGLPLRSAWITEDLREQSVRETATALRDAVLRLRKIHAWNLLESPPEARSQYRLALRRASDGMLLREGVVTGGTKYDLVLRATPTLPAPRTPPRYVYTFTIDSFGKSVLLFPRSGSVENRVPLPPTPGQTTPYPPPEIALGESSAFEVTPPFGVDTYFLLSTDEPLPNPWILEWDGIRTRQPQAQTPLEELLTTTGSAARAGSMLTPPTWTVERVVYESVPARGKATQVSITRPMPRPRRRPRPATARG
jgi:hypothetical protein